MGDKKATKNFTTLYKSKMHNAFRNKLVFQQQVQKRPTFIFEDSDQSDFWPPDGSIYFFKHLMQKEYVFRNVLEKCYFHGVLRSFKVFLAFNAASFL